MKWYKDTMLLDQNNHRRMSSYGSRHLLTLSNVRETDFGNYSCVADNSLGKERAYVDVSGEWVFISRLYSLPLIVAKSYRHYNDQWQCAILQYAAIILSSERLSTLFPSSLSL